jgi:hypothetical protein
MNGVAFPVAWKFLLPKPVCGSLLGTICPPIYAAVVFKSPIEHHRRPVLFRSQIPRVTARHHKRSGHTSHAYAGHGLPRIELPRLGLGSLIEYHGIYKGPTQATAARQSFNLLDNTAYWPGGGGADG